MRNSLKILFDSYTSPIVRCVETTKIIVKELGYKLKSSVQIDDRIIEIGENHDLLAGMSATQINKIFPSKLNDLEQKINTESNPFKKLKLAHQYNNLYTKTFKLLPTPSESYNSYVDFLNELSKQKYSRVLIITHGGTIEYIMNIICSIDMDNNQIRFNSNPKKYLSNCSITCVKYNKHENKYHLVSGPTDSHIV